MTAWLLANLAPIMFTGLVVFLLMGFPVAFSLAACGLFFGWIGIELGVPGMQSLMQALPLRIFGIMANDTLLAIPFFTFMGLILERSGMAEDLLDTIGQLFGPIRGGLAYAVILVGAMLAATTGVVAASVISMGLISLPIMLRYGYDRRIASGVIAASGTLAQIIPPSLVLIILADQLGKSVGDLYKGAFIPGFTLTGLYVLFVLFVTFWRPSFAPALPAEARSIREDDGTPGLRSLGVLFLVSLAAALAWAYTRPATAPTDETIVVSMSVGVGVAFVLAALSRLLKLHLLSRMAERVTFVLIPPLALIFLVLGTIFLGIATPTEGGAMGAVGALVMAYCAATARLEAASPGDGYHDEVVVFRRLHPAGVDRVQPVVPGRRRAEMGGAPLDQLAWRPARFPDRGEHPDLLPGVFPRFLRVVVHRDPAHRPSGRKARYRSGLVRRAAGGEHANIVHASAFRLCAVLSAQRGAARRIHGPFDQQTLGAGDHWTDLLGRRPVRVDPDPDGRPDHRVSESGLGRACTQGGRRPLQHPDRCTQGQVQLR
jgi:TRAP-type mannitol/chloroaromatic compound transport system permease large subunit